MERELLPQLLTPRSAQAQGWSAQSIPPESRGASPPPSVSRQQSAMVSVVEEDLGETMLEEGGVPVVHREKLRRMQKRIVEERIVREPGQQVVERIVKVPHRLYQTRVEEIRTGPVTEKVVEVPKIVKKVVEIEAPPRVEFVKVPKYSVREIRHMYEETLYKEVEVPQYVEVPIDEVKVVECPVPIVQQIPKLYECVSQYEVTVPRIVPKYRDIVVPVYVPQIFEAGPTPESGRRFVACESQRIARALAELSANRIPRDAPAFEGETLAAEPLMVVTPPNIPLGTKARGFRAVSPAPPALGRRGEEEAKTAEPKRETPREVGAEPPAEAKAAEPKRETPRKVGEEPRAEAKAAEAKVAEAKVAEAKKEMPREVPKVEKAKTEEPEREVPKKTAEEPSPREAKAAEPKAVEVKAAEPKAAAESKVEAKAEAKPRDEAKAEAKVEAKTEEAKPPEEPKPEAKAEPKSPEPKAKAEGKAEPAVFPRSPPPKGEPTAKAKAELAAAASPVAKEAAPPSSTAAPPSSTAAPPSSTAAPLTPETSPTAAAEPGGNVQSARAAAMARLFGQRGGGETKAPDAQRQEPPGKEK